MGMEGSRIQIFHRLKKKEVNIKTKVKEKVRLRENDNNIGILSVGDGFVCGFVGVQIFCCWNTIEMSWDQIEG